MATADNDLACKDLWSDSPFHEPKLDQYRMDPVKELYDAIMVLARTGCGGTFSLF